MPDGSQPSTSVEVSDVFNPQSPLAKATADLLLVTFVISGLILALVTALVFYCIVRFRRRPGPALPVQIGGHKELEMLWTVAPLLVVGFIFVLTIRAMSAADPTDKSGDPDIVVIGHQYWWEIRYPRSGVVTANEVHIPVGRRLLVELRTADVIHDFWVPQLGRKMDMVPDRANSIWLKADRPGLYHGACAEFCGTQHAWMRILVIAEPAETFERWEQSQMSSRSPIPSASRLRGAKLVRELTCVSCHVVEHGIGAPSAGPDLRHVASRRTLGAGVMENSPENLARWIQHPQAVKPGNLMPSMQLTDEQVADMVNYFLAP